MPNDLKIWEDFLNEVIKENRKKISLINYAKKILSSNSVIIFEFEHLSRLVGFKKDYLAKMVFECQYFYHNFEIKKRNGTYRNICAPSNELYSVQRWIYDNLLKNIPLNDSCVGFREKFSIKDNAIKHVNQPVILKLDLKDFFPSINKKRVISVFRNIGYSPNLSYILASLCTLNESLPQGAPTSPVLSNIIAKRLDARILGFANKFNLEYSRYADDITLSGNCIPNKFIKYLMSIIVAEGFNVNQSKTRFLKASNRKIITGISISSGKLTIPKKKKRQIRQEIHYIKTFGYLSHQKTLKITDPIYLERLLGYLFFWKFVDSDNKVVLEYINIIKNEIKKLDSQFLKLKLKNPEFIG